MNYNETNEDMIVFSDQYILIKRDSPSTVFSGVGPSKNISGVDSEQDPRCLEKDVAVTGKKGTMK